MLERLPRSVRGLFEIDQGDADLTRRSSALVIIALLGLATSMTLMTIATLLLPDPMFVYEVHVPLLVIEVLTLWFAKRGNPAIGGTLFCLSGQAVLTLSVVRQNSLNIEVFFMLLFAVVACAVMRAKDVKWLALGYLVCVALLFAVASGETMAAMETERILVPLAVTCVTATAATYLVTTHAERAIADQRRAMLAAQQAELQASRFLESMSHELRTPLNAIIGYSELLEEEAADQLDDASLGDLAAIGSSSRHLLGLIERVLDLSSLGDGGFSPEGAEWVDAREVAERAARTMRQSAEAKHHTLVVDAPEDAVELCTHPARLEQVLLDLVDNAIKFTEPGGHIALKVYAAGEDVAIDVRDDGPGIDEDTQNLIFMAFAQLDPSATRRHDGLGLGLTLAHEIMLRLGGTLSVESRPGKGARFTVLLPVDPATSGSPG